MRRISTTLSTRRKRLGLEDELLHKYDNYQKLRSDIKKNVHLKP